MLKEKSQRSTTRTQSTRTKSGPGHLKAKSQFTCQICGKSFPTAHVVPARFVRPAIVDAITVEYKNWSNEGYVCHEDLNRYRSEYVQKVLTEEKGELSDLELEVIRSLKEHDILSQNLGAAEFQDFTLGERLADRVASFGGSWTFITFFASVLIVWIAISSIAMIGKPFDPTLTSC
ncbi:hypothetical protein Q31a_13530 [Aureliella helgolandensis]|uniref:Uncharacterized protein n=2 Tax=Aureliella helgolandensis TaxID=2527968 RepID=A0A518G388_9BACT|nr:hypothetical protein Q31a_13530 [Aureliella helgolandensis]